jgi:beta-lactamase class A
LPRSLLSGVCRFARLEIASLASLRSAEFAHRKSAFWRGPVLTQPAMSSRSATPAIGQMGQQFQVGSGRLRAGLPMGWRAGDKTGTGLNPDMPDRINDVAVFFWPRGRKPWVLACFYEGPSQSTDWVRPQDEAVLAQVGRLAARFALAT